VVAVVGLGLMGGSLALSLRRADPGLEVVGIDSDPHTLRKAVESGAVTAGSDDLALCAGAEIVFLAVPVPAMRALLPGLPRTALVSDLGSTKVDVTAWAAAAGLDFVGGHPMCGREESGFDAARADLFKGAAWVLSREEPRLEGIIRAAGAHSLVIEPEQHDRLVAGISHTAFVLSAAYLLAITGSPDWKAMRPLAASGFRDMTRLAGGSAEMYAGIVSTNGPNIVNWLTAMEASLAKIRRHVEAGDTRVAEIFEDAHEARRRWLAEEAAGKPPPPAAGRVLPRPRGGETQ